MFLIIDSKDKIVCATNDFVYTKILDSNGLWGLCNEAEATAIYSPASGKHYPTKTNLENGVIYHIVESGTVPEDLGQYEYYYRAGEFTYVATLDDMKAAKQVENKLAFQKFLAGQFITWTDGKQYGVTEEDQAEINLNMTQYQMSVSAGVENPILEWHAIHEECVPWEVSELSALVLQIAAFVYPYYHQMQQYKTSIYAATTPAELSAIVFDYENINSTEDEQS